MDDNSNFDLWELYVLPLVDFVHKKDLYVLPLVYYVPKEDIVIQYFDLITSLQLHLFTVS